ncbi:hypothetical protein T10_446 [Trichinella papuae]|uniref:Uncharacterized protein n=1 Tax=Trichinella papuae TaxID=268474 RepID=A0A0V1MBV4_9BILA|nr:hypothetical protein T10_446 [Trichinella papuae]
MKFKSPFWISDSDSSLNFVLFKKKALHVDAKVITVYNYLIIVTRMFEKIVASVLCDAALLSTSVSETNFNWISNGMLKRLTRTFYFVHWN